MPCSSCPLFAHCGRAPVQLLQEAYTANPGADAIDLACRVIGQLTVEQIERFARSAPAGTFYTFDPGEIAIEELVVEAERLKRIQ